MERSKMNNVTELLKKASSLEKEAYFNYVKGFSSSGIATLVNNGVPFGTATAIIKQACEQSEKAKAFLINSLAFDKAAEYIAELEERPIKEVIEKKAESTPLNKLAALGFSEEEIEMMSQLPENLITKVASTTAEPWAMGTGVGMAREKTDPLIDWILQ